MLILNSTRPRLGEFGLQNAGSLGQPDTMPVAFEIRSGPLGAASDPPVTVPTENCLNPI
jgi:hypothetical protein